MTDPSANGANAAVDAAAPGAACQNCGAPLLGPHCYRCGQPVTGLVRHFTSVVGDFFDTVLNIDARVFRTLWPLFAKPGYLSCEYFAGRRVRYVSPVRLFVFLSIVTFFVARLTLSISGNPINLDDDTIAGATTVSQVEALRDKALAKIAQGRAEGRDVPGVDAGLGAAQQAVREKAQRRIDELHAAQARGEPPPIPRPEITLGNNSKPWDPRTNPLVVDWLPAFANHWINQQIARAESNVARMQQDPSLFKDAILSAVPSTLFVLLPVFALMLKVLYLFKRRLYMEHLIVALHSHAFLCLTLLLAFLAMALRDAVPQGFLHGLLGVVEGLLFAWMPVYLLLMQKHVYRQGWTLTVFKYCVLGFSYVMLLSFGAVFTVLASLVWA
ncbi:MAG TPA: DUF3667 domain-containing protein [Luteimonas sp.]|jgi:hypothetical protein|nr:DUF3667 domain-containing protein [Luteimonas sp.]